MRFLLVILSFVFVVAQGARAQLSVEEVADKVLSALGGRDKFDEVQVVYSEGTMSVGVPGASSSEDQQGGDNSQQVVRFWWVPFEGIKSEFRDAKNIMGAIFTRTSGVRYNALLADTNTVDQYEVVPDYEARTTLQMYNKFSFVPALCINTYTTARNTQFYDYERIEGVRCMVLRYGQSVIYVDEKTYYPRKFLLRYRDEKDGKVSYIEYYFSDWRPTNTGLKMPFVVEQFRQGNDISLVYRYSKIQVNGGLSRTDVLETASYKQRHDAYMKTVYERNQKVAQSKEKRERGHRPVGVFRSTPSGRQQPSDTSGK